MKQRLFGMFVLMLVVAPLGMAVQSAGKMALPNKEAEARARKLVMEIFGDDIQQASSDAAQVKLAGILLQQGKDVKDDPPVRLACFSQARDLAMKAKDAGLALGIIDEISRTFDLDVMQQKALALNELATATTDKEAGAALLNIIRPLWDEAVDKDQYKAARILGEAAVNAAKKARSPSLVLVLQKRLGEIDVIEKNFTRLHVYEERLQKNPKDGEANLELAKYFGYQKKRWEKALPYLAACSDPSLQALAKEDLAQPAGAPEQLALADGWWERAGKEQNPAKLALQLRAITWYEKALPGLSGLNRTKATKRIEAVQDSLSGTPVTPVAAAGPVGEFKKFDGHTDEVRGVAFAPDGRYVASAGKDQSVRVWDLSTGKEAYNLRGHTKEVWAVAFHPNNRYLFSASWDATVRMWDFKTGQEAKRFTHAKDVNGLALSRDGGTMLTGCDDEKVYYWNVTSGEEIRKFTGHTNFVYAVAFAPDGRHIASGGVDKTVRVFDLSTGQLLKTFEGQSESVTNVAFTPDSRYVLSSGDSVIHVWDVTTGKEAHRIEGHQGRVPAMAISPDGRRLITGGDDRTIKLWDVATGKMLHQFAGPTDTITCLAFSADGRRMVSGSTDRTVRVWNLPAK